MPTLAEFRQQTGDAYSDMSDDQLAGALHRKFYSDMPRNEFDSKIGLGAAAAPTDQRPFTEKLGSFFRKVYENPPPTVAKIIGDIKGAPAAAQELTWGADPEAAKAAAGTIAGAASLALPVTPGARAGEGFLGRPLGTLEARTAPARATLPAAEATGAQAAVEAAGRLDVGVPKYLATEGTTMPQLAAGVRNVPWAGEPIVKSAGKLLEDLGAAKGEIAGAASSAETVGEQAKTGIADWIKTGSKGPVKSAYEKVDAMVNPEWGVPLENTANEVAKILGERANARIMGNSKAAESVLEAIKSPMDYEGIKRLRSSLGEKTPMELATSGINPVENKRIYSALTKDLGNVVLHGGQEGAFPAWQEANAIARLTKMQQRALSNIVGAKGDAAPEAVFSRLIAYAGSKSSADLNRLQLAKRAMGPDAWGEIGSALISRMGMAPEGKFSADRFVTAFANLSPAARNELFTPQQHAALLDLFTVSKHIQERITRFANPSGTARGVFGNMLAGGAMLYEPVSVITSMVGTRMAAHALSQPAVVRAAAAVSRAALRNDPVATTRALARLRLVAARAGLISAADIAQQNPPPR